MTSRGVRRPTENLAAYNLYVQGRYHLNQRTEEGLRKAVEFFEKALVEKLPPHVKTQTSVAIISGADHFFVGRLPDVDRTIAAWLKARHPELE